MYIHYKFGDKTLFTFNTVKYCIACFNCGSLTSRKLITSKGVIAKELHKALLQKLVPSNPGSSPHFTRFLCSEKCLKQVCFTLCLKGGITIRTKIEKWLNSPPQEYFFYDNNNKFIVRVIKNQKDDLNYLEFYKKEYSYSQMKNIQLMVPTEYITTLTSGINNLFITEEM